MTKSVYKTVEEKRSVIVPNNSSSLNKSLKN